MKYGFSARIQKTPKSFIREILKVTQKPEVISFAGGLPNPSLIDTEKILEAAEEVISKDGRNALQYSTTEGYLPLRKYIAERYSKRYGIKADPDEILITNGSQQCLDLIGKIFIDKNDGVVIERPGYLGAIQAFSIFEPEFFPVNLSGEGPDTEELERIVSYENPKLFYGIPNSQNPSGITYSKEKRKEISDILSGTDTVFVEDDAYGELNFSGKTLPPVKKYLPELDIMTGSFSKIVSPGMRMGWIYAPEEILDKISTAKQASDLHSNYLCQRIIAEYLLSNNIDDNIKRIREEYKKRCTYMIDLMNEKFPESVSHTNPEGGMFIWLTLPKGYSSMTLFDKAMEKNVAILPGTPFYCDGGGDNTARINFSNSDEKDIEKGIEVLSKIFSEWKI
ncbi:2-aminoadipate transaminase [Methanomicrobium sp. W14]|uniref:aminotransferase-like domain-containing protein n=1 Tax=Methanomicrobium sp. W14 TaxID=2817839 RepID=UPI001AE4CD4B|nr:PLP-dependent aminotransferase family protein [Methanomicrobium sp. W14]MBP2132786.1 2-aminoadipate transaminase [Methanomicrobium sp. W14]